MTLAASLCVCLPVSASDWRAGFAFGFGGAGVNQGQSISQLVPVQRAEGPGVFSAFADNMVSDNWTLGFEHSFGFRFAPFSAGASFTGLTARWFFWGPAPAKMNPDNPGAVLFSKRIVPYLGGASGLALAHLTRSGDTVATVDGSGIYFGFKGGLDYPYNHNITMRAEFGFSSTLPSASDPSITISELAAQVGIYFFL